MVLLLVLTKDQNFGTNMRLTGTFVRQVKHSGKPAGDKYADGLALYLHVKEAGKYWRMSYRLNGKQRLLALGVDECSAIDYLYWDRVIHIIDYS